LRVTNCEQTRVPLLLACLELYERGFFCLVLRAEFYCYEDKIVVSSIALFINISTVRYQLLRLFNFRFDR